MDKIAILLTRFQVSKKHAGDMKIKASMFVEQVEGLFKSQFGATVQIKYGGKLVDDNLSLGDARRSAED